MCKRTAEQEDVPFWKIFDDICRTLGDTAQQLSFADLEVDTSAAADRRIRHRKFVRRKSAGKITARRISRRILVAVNPL